jgi:hypothetical protein
MYVSGKYRRTVSEILTTNSFPIGGMTQTIWRRRDLNFSGKSSDGERKQGVCLLHIGEPNNHQWKFQGKRN